MSQELAEPVVTEAAPPVDFGAVDIFTVAWASLSTAEQNLIHNIIEMETRDPFFRRGRSRRFAAANARSGSIAGTIESAALKKLKKKKKESGRDDEDFLKIAKAYEQIVERLILYADNLDERLAAAQEMITDLMEDASGPEKIELQAAYDELKRTRKKISLRAGELQSKPEFDRLERFRDRLARKLKLVKEIEAKYGADYAEDYAHSHARADMDEALAPAA